MIADGMRPIGEPLIAQYAERMEEDKALGLGELLAAAFARLHSRV